MKILKFFLVASFMISTVIMVGCESDKTVTFDKLPKVSKNFISTHFKDITVNRVVKDKEGVSYNWDVYLSNGWELEFEKNGEWDHIDCKTSAVPSSILTLLPSGIVSYCKTNYLNTSIVEIDKERYGYQIELANDITLEFDKQGKFLRIDD